jgi:hypothetical protein
VQNTLDLVRILRLFPLIDFEMARSPSGKAEDCKSSIVSSILTRASISFQQKIPTDSISRDFLFLD